MTAKSSETNALLRDAARGDGHVLGSLLARHRDRLRRIIALRLDHPLQGRIDSSDVIQEDYLEASTRLVEYLRDPSMVFGISEAAAGKRYIRALERLKQVLADCPGGLEGIKP